MNPLVSRALLEPVLLFTRKKHQGLGRHVGQLKQRIELPATLVERLLRSSEAWGAYSWLTLRADEGEVLCAAANVKTGPQQQDIGRRYVVRGTVGEHRFVFTRAETILKRCFFQPEKQLSFCWGTT